jgi:hypothetical protein
MGTTVIALCFDKAFATMVHVGDSRIFRISGKNIVQLTEDHSWLNELIEDDEINEEQIETFQEKNIITRALGVAPTVKVDIHSEKYKQNDIYVLCTDGMHNSMPAQTIKRLIDRHQNNIDRLTHRLIEKAKRRDGSDNITVAVAKIAQDSDSSGLLGTSATIPEEDERLVLKEDRYVQDNYGDHKKSTIQKAIVPQMSQNKTVTYSLVLLTGLVCFILGMYLKNNYSNQASGQNYDDNVTVLTRRQKSIETLSDNNAGPAKNSLANPNSTIKRSRLNKNAVMAVVFFNSLEDYDKAMLEERATVLDKLQPYTSENGQAVQGSFSIFLIDSTNNVFRKTSGIQLPEYKGN